MSSKIKWFSLMFSVIASSLAIMLWSGLGNGLRASETRENVMELRTVKQVDVNRYMGVWYEIASIPQWFQKDCVGGTTATYTLRDDGDVDVLNQCRTLEGEMKKANGKAWLVDKESNAKLKVSFLPFGLKFFGGDYWIIDLGEDYEYAVVGHPSREYGWILSRTPELPEETLKGIVSRLEEQGYDFSSFRMTEQKNYAK